MTQISNIYNKRSRSILNQFNQTNIGGGVGGAHAAAAGHSNANHAVAHANYGNSAGGAASNHLSPNQNINQGRGSVGNSNNVGMSSANNGGNNAGEDHSNTKGSPRMGRMRGKQATDTECV